jgi:8-oxo-dGTP pyrophosphatase MutT (NUDIX family)
MRTTADPRDGIGLRDRAWQTAYRLGFPLARMWWRLWRAPHQGALVAIHVGPRLLLVRTSYRKGWTLPGGGVRRGEAPEAAARRELAEELGLVAPALHPAGVTHGFYDGRPDRVHFFELRLETLPDLRLDNRETVAARLFGPDEVRGLVLTGSVVAYLQRPRPSAAT